MPHLGAFQCETCPQNHDSVKGRSCPAWWETVQQSAAGEVRVLKSCAWEQLPYFLLEVIKASNRPAAVMESLRNELVEKVSPVMLPGRMQAGTGRLNLPLAANSGGKN